MNERTYIIYFEIFGKKMKTSLIAKSEEDAREKLLTMIIFHKVEKAKDAFNSAMDSCQNIMDILK